MTKTWFELQDELARKALEVMDARLHQHLVTGEISKREMWLITDTVYDTISGLVPWETADLIYAIRKDLEL